MRDALGRPRSVAVFGATSEIAGAVLDRLVVRGASRLVLAGRDPEAVERVAARYRDLGVTDVETVRFEATDLDGHPGVVDHVFSRGDVDVALVAFGILGDQSSDEGDPRGAARVAETNYTAAVSVGVALSTHLRRQGHGALVVLSSVAGERARRSNFVYGSSKAGLDAFYQGLASALEPQGVRVMVVRPGFVRTRMSAGLKPPPFSATAEEVARVVVSGLDRGARVVWAPPVLRVVMAVVRHLPTPVFRRLPL